MVGQATSSAARVLAHLLGQESPATRPEMALACDLSRPTVLAAVERLEQLGLVAAVGQRSGMPGRQATLYEVSPSVGVVVAVDIGGSNLRVAVSDARGRLLAEQREATVVTGGKAVVDKAVKLVRRVVAETVPEGQPLTAVSVSVPGVIGPDGATVHLAWNIGQPEPFDIRTPLAQAFDAPILLDNNVNLAAIGEQWRGAAQDMSTFAVIAVGAGVGAGIVHEGRLLQGAHGGAGEVGFLTWLAEHRAAPEQPGKRASTPDEAGGVALLQRARELRGWRKGAPTSVEELFARAAQGEALARDLVEEEGRRIALIALSICAVVDPEAVIFTGGVGSNAVLIDRVEALVTQLAPFSPTVVASALGERASLVGALALAVQHAQAQLVDAANDSPAANGNQTVRSAGRTGRHALAAGGHQHADHAPPSARGRTAAAPSTHHPSPAPFGQR